MTRVGGGAFPTELNDASGEHLRAVATSSAPSRAAAPHGWLDLPYSAPRPC